MINIRLTLVLLLLCSVLYPLIIWGIASVGFSSKAEGSLIRRNGQVIGSELIGQLFVSPAYFHGRPSATSPAYNAAASTGSNMAPTNPALFARMADSVASAALLDGLTTGTIAADRVYASASGLDPHITPANAMQQVDRVARERGLGHTTVVGLVQKHIWNPMFGPSTVNVLLLNLDLADLSGRN